MLVMAIGWGEWLSERRMRRWKTQSEMARATHIKQGSISQIETESLPLSIRSQNLFAYLSAIGVTPVEFMEATGQRIEGFEHFITQAASLEPQKGESHAHPIGYRMVPILGTVNGGQPDFGLEEEFIPESDYRPTAVLFVYTGSSMTDPITPDAAHSLQEGDRLLVDTAILSLQHGKLYVINISGKGKVVKMAERLGNQWWLRSRNEAEHPPFQADQAEIVGRVYKKLRSVDL